MKTAKLAMITALVAFALMSFANANLGFSKNVISLKEASYKTELVRAIYSQVNPLEFLQSESSGLYTAQVVVKKVVYLITGTYKEWRFFFMGDSGISPLCNIKNTNPFGEENPFDKAGDHYNPFGKSNPFGNKGKKIKPSPLKTEKAVNGSGHIE